MAQAFKQQDLEYFDLAAEIPRKFNISTIIKVFQETLDELSVAVQEQINQRLIEIFEKWQLEYGVYPPQPSKMIRALQSLGFSQARVQSLSYHDYISQHSGARGHIIPPWQCCNDVATAIDLFNKLLTEGYSPLNDYLQQKNSPRFDHIFAVALSIALKTGTKIGSTNFVRSAQKLVQIRVEILKTRLDQTKDIVAKEEKRKAAQGRRQAATKRNTRNAVFKAQKTLAEKTGSKTVLQKAIAIEVGISPSQVSRILKSASNNPNK